jgi:hypothetical protein
MEVITYDTGLICGTVTVESFEHEDSRMAHLMWEAVYQVDAMLRTERAWDTMHTYWNKAD